MTKRKIKTIEKPKPFMGLLSGVMNEVEFTPVKTLDKIKAPKKNRPIFRLRPMTTAERHKMNADNNNVTALGLLWSKSNGLSIDSFAELDSDGDSSGYLAMVKKFDSFADYEMRDEITRACILGMVGDEEFKTDNGGGMDKKLFQSLHQDLVTEFSEEIHRISNLSLGDVMGL